MSLIQYCRHLEVCMVGLDGLGKMVLINSALVGWKISKSPLTHQITKK